VGVYPLNCCHLAEQTFAGMTHYIDSQPLNRARIVGVDVRRRFSSDLASVVQLPRRAGEMASDNFAVAIFQFGIGRLEHPSKFSIGAKPAGVNLRSGGMRHQNDLFAGMCLNRIRHFGWGYFLGMGC